MYWSFIYLQGQVLIIPIKHKVQSHGVGFVYLHHVKVYTGLTYVQLIGYNSKILNKNLSIWANNGSHILDRLFNSHTSLLKGQNLIGQLD